MSVLIQTKIVQFGRIITAFPWRLYNYPECCPWHRVVRWYRPKTWSSNRFPLSRNKESPQNMFLYNLLLRKREKKKVTGFGLSHHQTYMVQSVVNVTRLY